MVDADDRKSRTNTRIKRGTGAITLQFRRSLPSKRQAGRVRNRVFQQNRPVVGAGQQMIICGLVIKATVTRNRQQLAEPVGAFRLCRGDTAGTVRPEA